MCRTNISKDEIRQKKANRGGIRRMRQVRIKERRHLKKVNNLNFKDRINRVKRWRE